MGSATKVRLQGPELSLHFLFGILARNNMLEPTTMESETKIKKMRGYYWCLCLFDARRGAYELLAADPPCIEQQEVDRPPPLGKFSERGLHARLLVQVQLERREN